MTLLDSEITKGNDSDSSLHPELVRDLEAMIRPQVVITDRKEVAIPDNLNPDPNLLVGYLRHVAIDIDTGSGTAEILEGHAQHHGRVRQAEEQAEGLPSPASYDERIDIGARSINGQIRFSIDSFTNAVTFQVHAAETFDADIKQLVKSTYKAWATDHKSELQALPQTGTHNIQYDYFPILPREKATVDKWYCDKSKLWRDGQLDEEYIDSVFQ